MTVEGINLDQHSLQRIIGFLTDVDELGAVIALNKLWSFQNAGVDLTRLPQSYEVLRPILFDVLVDLERAEAMKDGLYNLARSLSRSLKECKSQLRPAFLHCGIQMLPNEILGHIFEYIVHDDSDGKDGPLPRPEVVLSLVCSRFYSITLGLPSLWSRIAWYMSKAEIATRLGRSRGAALKAVARGIRPPQHFIDVFELHAPRWRHLKLRNAFVTARQLVLPNLESLDADSKIVAINRGDWKFPNVRDIKLEGAIPSSRSSLFSLKAIRSVTFSSGASLFIIDLIGFLISLPNLQDLSLDITDGYTHGRSYTNTPASGTLPSVTKFALNITVPTTLATMVQRLHMPALEKFSLRINDEASVGRGYHSPEDWLWLIPADRFASVKEVDLFFQNRNHEDISIEPIFTRFPRLEELSLDTPVNKLTLSQLVLYDSALSMPPLRCLSLQLARSGSESTFLQILVELLKQKGRWEGLKMFQFKGDHLLSREEAEEILTEDKVDWLVGP